MYVKKNAFKSNYNLTVRSNESKSLRNA